MSVLPRLPVWQQAAPLPQAKPSATEFIVNVRNPAWVGRSCGVFAGGHLAMRWLGRQDSKPTAESV